MGILEVQPPVSAYESVRFLTAQDSWRWGVGNFFVEKIPFSSRNGPVFAKKLVALYLKILESSSIKEMSTYHVYEFGAGMGMLSFCFLNQLKIDNLEIYRKTRLHITDSCSEFVTQLKSIQLFKDHLAQVELSVMKAENPFFQPGAKPVFAFSTYLIDSLPAVHIESDNGQLKIGRAHV